MPPSPVVGVVGAGAMYTPSARGEPMGSLLISTGGCGMEAGFSGDDLRCGASENGPPSLPATTALD